MNSSASIQVTVRVRPFSIREAAQLTRCDNEPTFLGDGSLAGTPVPKINTKGIRRVVSVMDDRVLVFDPPEENPITRFQKTILPQGKRVKDMRFGFDRVFDENATQEDVYEVSARPLIDSVLDGFNATVFAYGATGCGKTHTISGTPQQPGIIYLTMQELFDRIEAMKEEKQIELSLSYLEIYNETIRDLLIPGGSTKGLQLREDANQAITVAGLSSHSPLMVKEVMDMIQLGNANRTMSPTEANATSSRSHAVLQVNVTQKSRTADVNESHYCSTLSIIDLAGSERASVTKNRGERLLEGANINRSLLALGNCITALCDERKKNHIPYRDSKLTRLLKFSLGGNCKTVMIVCVSPSSQHYDETHNTLKYADRAKNIKTKVTRNIINVNRHVSQYVKAIYDLRQENEDLKKRLSDATREAMMQISKQQSSRQTAIKDGLKRIKAAYDQSKDMLSHHGKDVSNLKIIERRIALVSSWISAFDMVFAHRMDEKPPAALFKIHESAGTVLRELESNREWLQERLSSRNWERPLDSALQSSLRVLSTIDGTTDSDSAVLVNEVGIMKAIGERDILVSVAELQDDPLMMLNLTKAHFEAVATINHIMELKDEQQAVCVARQSLNSIIQTCLDATSFVVKPSGDLSSNMEFTHTSRTTPLKKRAAGPAPFGNTPTRPLCPGILSPAKSPRLFKVGTPKKKVTVHKKKKKSVRWGGDTAGSALEQIHIRSPEKDSDNGPATPLDMVTSNEGQILRNLRESVHGALSIDSPSRTSLGVPQKKSARMELGFLRKQSARDGTISDSTPPSDTSPLQEAKLSQVLNTMKSSTLSHTPLPDSGYQSHSSSDSEPLPTLSEHAVAALMSQGPQRQSMGFVKPKAPPKSMRAASTPGLGTTLGVRRERRKSPGSSPDSNGAFKVSRTRRSAVKENISRPGDSLIGGEVLLSASPRISTVNANRRVTISGIGKQSNLSNAALFEKIQQEANVRESTGSFAAGPSIGRAKAIWR